MEAEAETNMEGVWDFPVLRVSRRKLSPDAAFFAPANAQRELLAKQVTLELTEDDKAQLDSLQYEDFWDLPCPIIGCGARLSAMADFEDHYIARHTATCSVCSRVFPTTHLLNIHVAESHDSFFQAKVDRGYPMYECLVEGCGMKFNSDRARNQHLVDKHKFPTSFEFQKRHHPSKRQRQRLRAQLGSNANAKHHLLHNSTGRLKNSVEHFPDQEVAMLLKKNDGNGKATAENENMKMEVEQSIEDLTSAVSKLSTQDNTPKTVSFGHRHNRAFAFLPRSMHRKT